MTGPVLATSGMVQLSRLACGWSKKQLAAAVGVSASHVSRVESGVLPLAGKPMFDYAGALRCRPEVLCVPFVKSPPQGWHSRGNTTMAEWKRDRVWARANLIAMRLGRLAGCADIKPVLALPDLEPARYAPEYGEITVAQVLRRLWRITGPIRSVTELMEAAGIFVVVEDFGDRDLDAVTLRASDHHPHLVYLNAALPADRARLTLTHELGHLVMDAHSAAGPGESESRADAFAAEFLAPAADIAFDLDRVSVRTVHELDQLRITWGVNMSSLVARAHDRGALSERQYRAMCRVLNETGRMHEHLPGLTPERPALAAAVLEQLSAAGYTTGDIDDITLLTAAERAHLFQAATRPRLTLA